MARMDRADTAGRRGDVETTSTWAIVEGVVLIILGLVAVFARYETVARLVLAIALYLVVKGILEVIAAFRAEGEGGTSWDLAFGIIAILAGVMVFARDAIGDLPLATIIGAYLLVEALARFAIGWMVRGEDTGWVWVVGLGVLDLILAVYALGVARIAIATLAALVGVDIIGTGVVMAVVGALERTHRIRPGVTPA